MTCTWLHISDLHIRSSGKYDQDVVLDALVESVRYMRERNKRKPDLIFVTGDVARNGKKEEYEQATDFFDKLLEAAALYRCHLFLVPGNHDVDLDKGLELIRTLETKEKADNYFNPDIQKRHITDRLGAFQNWHNSYFQNIREMPSTTTCYPVQFVNIRGLRIAILSINSALFCIGGEDDHGKLFIGRRCLNTVLNDLKTKNAHLKIALMHHPLDWLSQIERSNIKFSLRSTVDIILHGHLHETDIENIVSVKGGVLHITAGAAYQTRERPNCALYSTFEDGNLRVFPIKYIDSPVTCWTLDPSVFPTEENYEGRFIIPRYSKTEVHYGKEIAFDSQAIYDKFKEIPDEDLLPTLVTEDNKVEITSLDEFILQRNRIFWIYGFGGMGKTYTLYQLWKILAKEKNVGVIYIPLKNIGPGEKPISKYIYDRYIEQRSTLDSYKALRDMISEMDETFVFLLDGINECRPEKIENVLDEIKFYLDNLSNVRVVLTSRSRPEAQPFEEGCVFLNTQLLSENKVKAYLKNKVLMNIENKKVVELLRRPMMLALFAKSYNPRYSNSSVVEIIETEAELIRYCLKEQLKKDQNIFATDQENADIKKFIINLVLPLIAVKTEKMKIETKDMSDIIEEVIKRVKEENRVYSNWYLGEDGCRSNVTSSISLQTFLNITGEQFGLLEEFAFGNKRYVLWAHETMKDWFTAKGLQIMTIYEQDNAVELINSMSRKLIEDTSKNYYLFPTALYLYELLPYTIEEDDWEPPNSNEQCQMYINSLSYTLLIAALSYVYDDVLRDQRKSFIFSMAALKLLNAYGPWDDLDEITYARVLSGAAYGITRLRAEDMPPNINLEKCREYALSSLYSAKAILEKYGNDPYGVITMSKVYGNLASYWLSKRNEVVDHEKQKEYIEKALSLHTQALKIRKRKDLHCKNSLIAQSFTGIASCYYYIGVMYDKLKNKDEARRNYIKSIWYHKKALKYHVFKKAQDKTYADGALVNFVRIIGCYFKLLGQELRNDYFNNIIDLLEKSSCLGKSAFQNNVERDDFARMYTKCIYIIKSGLIEIDETQRNRLLNIKERFTSIYNDLYPLNTEKDILPNL